MFLLLTENFILNGISANKNGGKRFRRKRRYSTVVFFYESRKHLFKPDAIPMLVPARRRVLYTLHDKAMLSFTVTGTSEGTLAVIRFFPVFICRYASAPIISRRSTNAFN